MASTFLFSLIRLYVLRAPPPEALSFLCIEYSKFQFYALKAPPPEARPAPSPAAPPAPPPGWPAPAPPRDLAASAGACWARAGRWRPRGPSHSTTSWSGRGLCPCPHPPECAPPPCRQRGSEGRGLDFESGPQYIIKFVASLCPGSTKFAQISTWHSRSRHWPPYGTRHRSCTLARSSRCEQYVTPRESGKLQD